MFIKKENENYCKLMLDTIYIYIFQMNISFIRKAPEVALVSHCCETRRLYRRVIVIRLAVKQRPRHDANAFNDQLPLPSILEIVRRPVFVALGALSSARLRRFVNGGFVAFVASSRGRRKPLSK